MQIRNCHIYYKLNIQTKNIPHSLFNRADFCVEGTGHFRSSGQQIQKSIRNEHKIISWSYCAQYLRRMII